MRVDSFREQHLNTVAMKTSDRRSGYRRGGYILRERRDGRGYSFLNRDVEIYRGRNLKLFLNTHRKYKYRKVQEAESTMNYDCTERIILQVRPKRCYEDYVGLTLQQIYRNHFRLNDKFSIFILDGNSKIGENIYRGRSLGIFLLCNKFMRNAVVERSNKFYDFAVLRVRIPNDN